MDANSDNLAREESVVLIGNRTLDNQGSTTGVEGVVEKRNTPLPCNHLMGEGRDFDGGCRGWYFKKFLLSNGKGDDKGIQLCDCGKTC